MDNTAYNGWPNVFTWQVYTHLSSYPETDGMAYQLVAEARHEVAAADALRDWVQEMIDVWYDECGCTGVLMVSLDLVHAALRQVVWERIARAYSSS